MIKNTIIVGIMSFVFLIATTITVCGVDEEKTIFDSEDDVLDFEDFEEGEYTDQKPNIDIISLTYTKTGRLLSLNLEVKGVIEDRGDLEDEFSIDAVLYTILITTSEGLDDQREYEITYVNEDCQLNGEKRSSVCDVDGSILSLSFTLEDADETIYGLVATANDVNLFNNKWYLDELISMNIIALVSDEYTGKVGEAVNFSGAAIGGNEPYVYSWDFGDGTNSEKLSGTSYEEMYADHIYEKAGTYEAILTVTDSDGNVTSTAAKVIISSISDTDDNSEYGLLIFISLISIIIIIAVAVVVYIIKR